MSTTAGLRPIRSRYNTPQVEENTSPFYIIDEEEPQVEVSSSPLSRGLPDNFALIATTDIPPRVPWKYPMMYKYGNNDVMYIWQIGFDGSKMYVCHGPVTNTTVDTRDVELNTSGRDIWQQGHQETLKKYTDKFYAGYVQAGSSQTAMVKGMKGYPFKSGCIRKFPVVVSPKLDGTRMLSQYISAGNLSCRSYLNKPICHLKHIEEDLNLFFAYLPCNSTLDGELYKHGMCFHDIISAVKTYTSEHKDVKTIEYHIFDIDYPDNPPSELRYNLLLSACNRLREDNPDRHISLVIVPNYICNTEDEITQYKDHFVSLGYEGCVIRYTSYGSSPGTKDYERSRYKPGRSKRIFKYKNFIDEEATVVGIKSADGKESGAALLILRDKLGINTAVRFGTTNERRIWMNDPSIVLNRQFTFRYYARSADGAPIQPTGVCFRDYE